MKRVPAAAAAFCVVVSAAARADRAEGDKCAASLTPQARLIYDTALTRPIEGASLYDLLTERVRTLVLTGKVGLFDARPAAETAADCLRLVQIWPHG